MELTHSTRLSSAISRIRCVFDSGSPFQSWLKQSMSLPRKEPAATVAGAFLIATFPFVISSSNFSRRRRRRQEKGETEGRSSSSLNPHAYPSLCLSVALWLCGSVAVYFAVDELTRPHLEIDQRPEPLG